MKARNILVASAFVLAIGSGFASTRADQDGFSRKQDVQGQTANCQLRNQCSGTGDPCEVSVNMVTVRLYDGIPVEGEICGTQLLHE